MGDTRGTVHFVGIDVQIGALLRQRCAWCGDVLLDYDLERLAVPVGQREGPATWPVGTLVEVDGNATWVVEHDAADPLPENTCARLLADLEARFKESLGEPPVLLSSGPKYEEFVLTWHPWNGAPPVEVPLRTHWVFPSESCGEFVVSTREIPAPAGEPESDEDVWCPHPACHDRPHVDGTHSDEFGNPPMAATERVQRVGSVKPGWCPIHPGMREPCWRCNAAVRRPGVRGA